MIDAKLLRDDIEVVKKSLEKRCSDIDLSDFTELDKKRRKFIVDMEELKSKQNSVSKLVPQMQKKGNDVSSILGDMKQLSKEIKTLENFLKEIEQKIYNILISIPNIVHESVPIGKDDSDNVEVVKVLEPKKFDFTPKPHWELGESLNILDPARASKVTGSRFHFYKGMGAKLQRALYNFMLDTNSNSGYTEIDPPLIVNEDSMLGTGQLPKFEHDMFKISNSNFYLAPTSEVSIINMHRNEILDGSKLPMKYCAMSQNFRKEAGSAGRDTRGLIRQHQFSKIELVHFCRPENSFEALENLILDARKILDLLKLPYRVVSLCTGDLTFSSTKTFDIEVWMPSYNRYVEISSCSNTIDFQARRSKIRYKDNVKDKAKFVHILNGSGVAIGRCVAAILENYQKEDGTIIVPDVLVDYMGEKIIS